MERAYSVLQVKALDEDKRILTGIASTPSTDRSGDIVDPKGAQFSLPMPFLWQHDSTQPIGHVTDAKVTANGIQVSVQLAKVDEPGTLKDRLDEAWQSIKAGLVQGLSIGFSAKRSDTEPIKDSEQYGLRYMKWLWLELSAVTIPANGDCSITAIKSADQASLRASLGAQKRPVVRLDPAPAVSGTQEIPGVSGDQKTRRKGVVYLN
jgi:HK97 family phage prohead protease